MTKNFLKNGTVDFESPNLYRYKQTPMSQYKSLKQRMSFKFISTSSSEMKKICGMVTLNFHFVTVFKYIDFFIMKHQVKGHRKVKDISIQ